MPNRIVREGINSSARINALSMGAEVFYRRLMSVVDDFGRYHGSVVTLRGACWPTNPERIREKEVSKWLTELLKSDDPLVRTYCIGGATYVELQDFGQQVRGKSKFPDPPWYSIQQVKLISASKGISPSQSDQERADQESDTTCSQNVSASRSRIRSRISESEATTGAQPPPLEMPRHSDYPKTDAAVRRRFPTADLPIVIRIVEAATQAYVSVGAPKIPEPSDADFAEAVEQASSESRKQDSAALYLRTVPAVVKSWAELGRHPPAEKPATVDRALLAAQRSAELRRQDLEKR